MKDNIARGVAFCFLAVCTSASMALQQPTATAQAPTIRVQSSLVLVDVIGQDRKSGLPVRDFKKEDFTATKADSQNLAPRQNFWDRNHCFGPRLSISRRTTEWELPI